MPSKIVEFKKFSNVLYSMDPNYKKIFIITNKYYQFMNNIEEKLKCLSSRQQNLANKYWELYKEMGTTTVDDLKSNGSNGCHQEQQGNDVQCKFGYEILQSRCWIN